MLAVDTVTDDYRLTWTAVHVIHSDLILGRTRQSSVINTIFFGAFLWLVLGAGPPAGVVGDAASVEPLRPHVQPGAPEL